MSNSAQAESKPRVDRSPVALSDCGLSAATEIIGDRWSLLILRSIFYGVSRFADIKSDIKIPGSTLSTRLKALLEAGLLQEHPYRDGMARTRVEYEPTPKGETLRPLFMALMAWGDEQLRGKQSKLVTVNKETGEALRLGFVDQTGREVEQENIDYRIKT